MVASPARSFSISVNGRLHQIAYVDDLARDLARDALSVAGLPDDGSYSVVMQVNGRSLCLFPGALVDVSTCVGVSIDIIPNDIACGPAETYAVSSRVIIPERAAKLVSLVAGPRFREGILGDLDEDFTNACKRFDPQFACRQYWTDALSSIPGLAYRRACRLLGIVALGEFIRCKLGF